MPLHIPVHQYKCYTAYSMIYRSIPSDPHFNNHLSSTQTYVSYSIRSMERNYVQGNSPSHSSASIYMLSSIQYDLQNNSQWPWHPQPSIQHPNIFFLFYPVNGQELCWVDAPSHSSWIIHTYCATYNMIYRSIFSAQDINRHLSGTQTYLSDSIRSMERNYVEWNAP